MSTGVFLCPICLNEVAWNDDDPVEVWEGSEYVEMRIADMGGPTRRDAFLRNARRRCPRATGPGEPHYLPSRYGDFGAPIVVGFVGGPRAGKSHLLAAMIGEMVQNNGLARYGLSATPIDFNLHAGFMQRFVDPLMTYGRFLEGTTDGIGTFVDALLISTGNDTRPLTFFDVSGEDLSSDQPTTRFLNAADALVFVVNPSTALRWSDEEDPPPGDNTAHDQAFDAVLSLVNPGRRYLNLAAAIVVSKSDRLRFIPPVDRWLAADASAGLDAATFEEESRDVYGFLHSRGAAAWLKPFDQCRRATLHFASATGGEQRDGFFPRKVAPQRVLRPLLAVLAMTGVLSGADAGAVGT